MRQFLRFALIFVLIIIGFGGGVCGVFGLAMSVTAGNGTGLVLVLSAVGLLVALGCGLLARRLIRRMNAARQSPSP